MSLPTLHTLPEVATALRLTDVDLSAATAHIRETKTGKPRLAHLPPVVVAALANLTNPCGGVESRHTAMGTVVGDRDRIVGPADLGSRETPTRAGVAPGPQGDTVDALDRPRSRSQWELGIPQASGEGRVFAADWAKESGSMNANDLIRDIQAATGPNTDIDLRIASAIGMRPHKIAPELWVRQNGEYGPLPHFTGSLDAARGTFGDHAYDMEPDWNEPARKRCTIIHDAAHQLYGGTGATEPLAMCAAAMRLKEREEGKDGK